MSTYQGDAAGEQNEPVDLTLPDDFVTLRKAQSVNRPLEKVADRLEWLRTEMPVTNTKGVDPDGETYADGTYAVKVEAGAIVLVPFSSGALPSIEASDVIILTATVMDMDAAPGLSDVVVTTV